MEPVLRRLRELMNNYADELAVGTPPDYAKYREMVGVISGLAMAEREILDQLEKERDFEE